MNPHLAAFLLKRLLIARKLQITENKTVDSTFPFSNAKYGELSLHRAHLVVEGIVQGVSFRYCCRREAMRFNLTGWVRNRRDGGVEIVAEGLAENLREFTAWCRRGPSYARVDAININTTPATGEFTSFDIVG